MGTRKRKRKKSGCLLGFLLLLAFGGAGAFAYNSGILGTAVRELEGNTEYVCRFLPFEDPGYLAAVCREDMETAPKIEYL